MDRGVADFESGELVGEPVTVDVFELVKGGVSGFDDDRGEQQFRESFWKASVPSESVAARLSRLLRSTAARIAPSGE